MILISFARTRFVAACLAASVAVAGLATTPSGAVAGFGDVPPGVFYTDAVQWMVDEGLTTGTAPGRFSPGLQMTRGELATFVWRHAGEQPGGPHPFSDVAPTAFHAAAVSWMYTAGLTTGTSPSTYSPDRKISRSEVATVLWRLEGSPPAPPGSFADVAADAFYATAVDWMAAQGITTGTTPTTFAPLRQVTRAEFATFLYRYSGSPPVVSSGGGTCTGASGAGASGAGASGAAEVLKPIVAPGVVQFSTEFESAAEFHDRFVTHAGDYVDPDLHRTGWLVENQPWWDTPRTVQGDHNRDCDGPDTSRTIDVRNPDDFVYHCNPFGDPTKGHLMTAFDTSLYAIISFSPDQTITNVTQVCWDVNATDLGGGKWTNMIVVPESLYQQFAPRMDYVTPGFNQDSAPGDFNIQESDHPGQVVFGMKDFRGVLTLWENDNEFWSSGVSITTTDKRQRFTKCLTETEPGTLTVTAERPDGSTSRYHVAGSFPDGDVRVIFQDDMYNPPKRDGYDPDNVTFHWDNIKITGRP